MKNIASELVIDLSVRLALDVTPQIKMNVSLVCLKGFSYIFSVSLHSFKVCVLWCLPRSFSKLNGGFAQIAN